MTVLTTIYDKSDLNQNEFVKTHWIDGIEVIAFNVRMSNKDSFAKRISTFLLFALHSSAHTLTREYDLILSSSGPITTGIPGLLAKFLKNACFAFEVRDLWPEGAVQLDKLKNPLAIKAATLLAKLCYLHSNGIVALSSGMKDWIRDRYKHSPILIAPNASDNAFFSRFDAPASSSKPNTIIYAGTIGAMDGCSAIIDAAKAAEEKKLDHLKFRIIGDGNEREALEKQSQAYRLENIAFVGLQKKSSVARALKSALCSIYTIRDRPALRTGSPNKMFDSFAASCPVIHNSGGWIKTLTDEHECGFFFKPENPEELVHHANRLYHDEALRQKASIQAKWAATTLFDRDTVSRELLKFLKAIFQRSDACKPRQIV